MEEEPEGQRGGVVKQSGFFHLHADCVIPRRPKRDSEGENINIILTIEIDPNVDPSEIADEILKSLARAKYK